MAVDAGHGGRDPGTTLNTGRGTVPEKTVALAKLEYSLKFRRDNDLVEQARQAMGLTTEALDKLWQQAAAIE